MIKLRPKLTEEQIRAATSRCGRVFVEAGPGAGKTTVAAERFGIARYSRSQPNANGVVAVSFTVAATQELRQKVVSRWGRAALSGRSRVGTIDSEIVSILALLLRLGLVHWPAGHLSVEPVDSWGDGHPLWKYNRGGWPTFVPRLVDGQVVAVKVPGKTRRINKGDLERLLEDGQCTHDDVRQIVWAALKDQTMREAVLKHRRATVAHLIVDEVFDADELDLEIIKVHCEAAVPTTVVGDRWQALYEFRNAQPHVTENFLNDMGFVRREVLHSHRYKTDQVRQLATSVRGAPTQPPDPVEDVDVVIAPWWQHLWDAPPWILPISFGPVRDQTDAMLSLFLDHLVRKHFGRPARSRAEALMTFGIDPITTETWPEFFTAFETRLVDTSTASAEMALGELRRSAPDIGAGRKVRARRADTREAKAVGQMQKIAERVAHGPPFVPGITAHQAKGKEWVRVGVRLDGDDLAALGAGLVVDNDRHRILYVALTRATHLTGMVAAP